MLRGNVHKYTGIRDKIFLAVFCICINLGLTTAKAESLDNLYGVEKLCGIKNTARSMDLIIKHLQHNGWTVIVDSQHIPEIQKWLPEFREELSRPPRPEDISAAYSTMLAMTYSAPKIDQYAQKLAGLNNNYLQDMRLTSFERGDMRLTVSFPLVGSLSCAVTGSDNITKALRQIEFKEIEVLPFTLGSADPQKEPTRHLYRGALDERFKVFLAVVDKTALSENLRKTNDNTALQEKILEAIPEVSAFFEAGMPER